MITTIGTDFKIVRDKAPAILALLSWSQIQCDNKDNNPGHGMQTKPHPMRRITFLSQFFTADDWKHNPRQKEKDKNYGNNNIFNIHWYLIMVVYEPHPNSNSFLKPQYFDSILKKLCALGGSAVKKAQDRKNPAQNVNNFGNNLSIVSE